jgi:hypothetical protein
VPTAERLKQRGNKDIGVENDAGHAPGYSASISSGES